MKCPICGNELRWSADFSCEDIFGCECGEGIVGEYSCAVCHAEITVQTDCKGEEGAWLN